MNGPALQVDVTATADVLQAQLRATAHAADSTQSVAQTQVQTNADALRAQQTATADILQAQLRATANAALATQSAAATLTQQAIGAGATLTQQSVEARAAQMGTAVAGTATAIAHAIAVETQSVVATEQRRADLAEADAAEQERTIAFLWGWGPSLLVIALLGLGGWAFWHWEVRRRTPPEPTFEQRPPTAPPIRRPLEALPDPDERLRQERQRPSVNDPVSGWLAEIKRKLLLPGGKDHDDNPNA